jgi:hypothetical protein
MRYHQGDAHSNYGAGCRGPTKISMLGTDVPPPGRVGGPPNDEYPPGIWSSQNSMPASWNAVANACRHSLSGPSRYIPKNIPDEYVRACGETRQWARPSAFPISIAKYCASVSLAAYAKSTTAGILSGAARRFSDNLFPFSSGNCLHVTKALRRSCSLRASAASLSKAAARSLALAARAFARAASARASSPRARASSICLFASFWVASVIWYPTHAETNADAIPTPPNTSAEIVAHRNMISQNGSVNDHINCHLHSWRSQIKFGDCAYSQGGAV